MFSPRITAASPSTFSLLISLASLVAGLPAAGPLRAAEETSAPPIIDVYVSTGDNHFLGSSLPIDSPESIEATFDFLKHVNHARRVYWRGLEEANWIASMQVRPENCRYYSLWQWLEELYATVHPDQLAVKAARARNMEIWGMGTLWDWGGGPDTPTFGDYPFPFESKLRLAHPEWAPQDKHGVRRQGGPIELAYPAARQALVALIADEARRTGYDGVCLITYVENYAVRFADEFGYSDPIVQDFQRLHGVDLRTQPFRRGASREDWLRLRGSYVTAFLRELKAALSPGGIKLGLLINPNNPREPLTWNVPELVLTAGSHWMDVDTWIRDSIVDELVVSGNSSPQAQLKTLEDLRFLARGTGTAVSVMTSSPFGAQWRPLQQQGLATLLAVSDDVQHLDRGFVPEQPAAALASDDVFRRMRALGQCSAGKLTLDQGAVAQLATSQNLIERRLALQALGKMESADLQPLLTGLEDPENGVRCSAALALGQRRNPQACGPLLAAVQRHGNHMLRECAVIALRKLQPLPTAELRAALETSSSPAVREAAMRTLQYFPSETLLPAFQQALADEHRFVRYAAAEGLSRLPRSVQGITILIAALQHADPVVANRAALSLGQIAAQKRPETAGQRAAIVAALAAAFQAAPDDGWSFRPRGNALLAVGAEGRAALEELRDQRADLPLAERAWHVVDLTQASNTFSTVTPEANEAAMQRRPVVPPAGRDLHVDPRTGNDAHDGIAQPLRSIAAAIKRAAPGDTIHLAPVVYHDFAGFFGKKGEPGRPVTLDGHGATLDGSDPLDPAEWKEVAPGLFAHDNLLPRLDDAVILRWYFLFDGRMNRMGRVSKGKSVPLKAVADLQPGQWTFVKDPSREKPPSKQIYGTFYIKLPPGQKLADARIAVPLRSAGVQLSGDNAHLVIRNVTATHVYNDGFNIHGDCRDVVFENIQAIECGDDGISAHETAQYRVDGLVSRGNSTGICDTVAAQTSYNRVFIADCVGYDLYFLDDGRYRLTNSVVLSAAQFPLVVTARDGATSRLSVDNVYIKRIGPPQAAQVASRATLAARRLTLDGLDLQATGPTTCENCLINGQPHPADAQAPGADRAQLLRDLVPAEYRSKFGP